MTSHLALLVGVWAWCNSKSRLLHQNIFCSHNRVLDLLKVNVSAVTQEGEVHLRSVLDRGSGTSHLLHCDGADSYRGGQRGQGGVGQHHGKGARHLRWQLGPARRARWLCSGTFELCCKQQRVQVIRTLDRLARHISAGGFLLNPASPRIVLRGQPTIDPIPLTIVNTKDGKLDWSVGALSSVG